MESIKSFSRITEFVAQEAMTSMARSAWMSWLVIVTIAVSLSVLGGSWLVVTDLKNISHEIGSQVKLSVFLNSEADAKGVEAAIKEMPNIKLTKIVFKDQAWEQLQNDMKSKMTTEEITQYEAERLARKIGALLDKASPEATRRALELLANEAKLAASNADTLEFLADIAEPDCGDY